MIGRSLVTRDPALAAVLGLLTLDSDFGSDFGGDFGDDVHGDFGADIGDDIHGDFGADFAAEIGAEFGAAAPKAALARPSAQQALAAWRALRAQKARGMQRRRLLRPNMGSDEQIERYIFPISQTVTLGTAAQLALQANPDVTIRPQRAVFNAPVCGFAYINEIKVANVSATVGPGYMDANTFSGQSVGVTIDAPTLSPAQRASVLGLTTVLVPPGYVAGAAFIFSAQFIGPATMAGM